MKISEILENILLPVNDLWSADEVYVNEEEQSILGKTKLI